MARGGAETPDMGRRIRKTAEAGYTILEAIIVVAIFAAVFISIYSMFDTNWSVYRRGEARSNVQQNARLALEQMSTEIRQAGFFPENFGMYNPVALPLWPTCGAALPQANRFPVWVGITGDSDQDGTLVIYGDVDPNITPRPPVPPAPVGTTCSNFVRYSVTTLGGAPPTTAVLCRAANDWGAGCAGGAAVPLASLPVTANVARPIILRFAFYDSCDRPLPNAQVVNNATAGYRLDGVTLTGGQPAAPTAFTAGCGVAVPGGAGGQERAAVRRILVTLTLSEDVPGLGVQVYTLTTDIRLRNMPAS